jgi:excisionase family DNA binding protein
MSVQEAAGYLHLAPSTLYKLVSAGVIAHAKPGGKKLLFLRQDLDMYVLRHRREALDVVAEQHEEQADPRPAPRLRGRRRAGGE